MKTDSKILEEPSKQTGRDYPLFAQYCTYLDKGLRKEALKYLDQFLDSTKDWDFFAKSIFCKQLFNASKETNDLDIVLTTNLTNKLIEPTLLEITIAEPENYLAFKWYRQYFQDTTFIRRAYELNPSEESIKQILLKLLEDSLWLSTHHLPDGYLGEIEEDETNLDLAFSIVKTLDKTKASQYLNIFMDLKNQIDEYKSNSKKPNR